MPRVKDVVVRKAEADELEACRAWPIWTCDVSEFDWQYDEPETCLILEGEVTVADTEGNETVHFGPGDMVVFPKGLKCVWKVEKPVRKHYRFG